jgi:hypothetical protein
LDSSSDYGDNDDNDDDDDTNTHALHQHFHSKYGGCKFPFSFDGNEGDGNSGDDDDNEDDDNDETTYTMFPKLPYPHWLQVVTPPLLLLAPLVEMIVIRPVVLPIL